MDLNLFDRGFSLHPDSQLHCGAGGTLGLSRGANSHVKPTFCPINSDFGYPAQVSKVKRVPARHEQGLPCRVCAVGAPQRDLSWSCTDATRKTTQRDKRETRKIGAAPPAWGVGVGAVWNIYRYARFERIKELAEKNQ